MFGARVIIKRGLREEAEKPFWISFSDLMSALMVLFLVVMSVALLAVTKTVSEAERRKAERDYEIEILLKQVQDAANQFGGLHVSGQIVDFGDRARFEFGSYSLTPQQSTLLRTFVPKILAIANDELGKKWLKQIVVEGFTDQQGTYLFNLNLSLQRSQRVLCALLAEPLPGERTMSELEKEQIRALFLVGGYSFNSAKAKPEESRRIELRLEFRGLDERSRSSTTIASGGFGSCAI